MSQLVNYFSTAAIKSRYKNSLQGAFLSTENFKAHSNFSVYILESNLVVYN